MSGGRRQDGKDLDEKLTPRREEEEVKGQVGKHGKGIFQVRLYDENKQINVNRNQLKSNLTLIDLLSQRHTRTQTNTQAQTNTHTLLYNQKSWLHTALP